MDKAGKTSWSMRDNLDSLPFSSPAVEFYMEQDSQQAVNCMRRIVSGEMKTTTASATELQNPVAGPMSDIISSKMRHATKKNPEERYETKFGHLASSNSSHSSSVEQSDLDVECAKKNEKRKKPKTKRKRSKSKSKAEDLHMAMCKKATKTLDKVNMLLDKYADNSSSTV